MAEAARCGVIVVSLLDYVLVLPNAGTIPDLWDMLLFRSMGGKEGGTEARESLECIFWKYRQ